MRKRNLNIFLSLLILIISMLFTLKIEISFKKFVDSYFIISGLVTCILIFKLLLEKGVFDTFGYSWQKTKKYVLFFHPKYWNNSKEEDEIKTFDDYLEYKEKKKWKNLNSLITTSLIHLGLSVILSLLIYYSS